MNERSKLQNVILVLLIVMTVTFGVLTGVARSRKGVEFCDGLLKVTESGDTTVYSGKALTEAVEITVTPEETVTKVVFSVGGRQTVCALESDLPNIETEHGRTVKGLRITKNGAVLFEGGIDPEMKWGWYDKDGSWDPAINVHVSSSKGGGNWEDYEITASTILRFAQGPVVTARGSWGLYLLLVVLTALLALDVLYPTVLFQLRYACDVRDPEPSDFYIACQRISWGGYTAMLFGGHIHILRI